MPTRELFQPYSGEEIRHALRISKHNAKAQRDSDFDLGIDYLENRQRDDIISELHTRYPNAQGGRNGAEIQPVTLPLAELVISEMATAYNRPVMREVVNEAGEVDEGLTKSLNDELSRICYNEKSHRLDQVRLMLGTASRWWHAKRGQLRPQLVLPQDIFPVSSDDPWADPTDPEDYAGYVVRVLNDVDDASSAKGKQWAFISRAQTTFYQSGNPYEFSGGETFDNPFIWEQTIDTEDHRGAQITGPLMVLTFAHQRIPIGRLISDVDVDLAYSNRELNIAWSMILHLVRTQGWGQLVLELMQGGTPTSQINVGPGFAIPLRPGETASYINTGVDFNGLRDVLSVYQRTLAIMKRLPASSVAVDVASAQSGFAKLVESLPKLEARAENIARLKAFEEQQEWPRIASIMRYLRKPGWVRNDLEKFKLRVKFSDIKFPQTPAERALELETKIKFHLTTAAQELMAETGEAREAAKLTVELNMAQNLGLPEPKMGDEQQVPSQPLNGAQVTALLEVVASAARGEIPRDTAIRMMVSGFQIPEQDAELMASNIGAGFVAAVEGTSAKPDDETEPEEMPQRPAAAPAPAPRDDILARIIGQRG